MPTIEVETNITSETFRRHFAKRVALWLHRQDIPINHVVTKYRDLAAAAVFSGPYPFDRLPTAQDAPPAFAFITCFISQDRPASFRRELAQVIVQATQPTIAPDYLFIAFRPVDSHDFIKGQDLMIYNQEESLP